jgi:threonine/homoserine/homoserine lactone efflux protein
MTLAFLLTSLVIVATPGTGALYAIAAGLTRGARAGVLAAFAGTLGTIPHLVAAVTGLAALLHASGIAFAVLKYAGVAYLLYMAWATWRDHGALSVDEGGAGERSVWGVLGAGSRSTCSTRSSPSSSSPSCRSSSRPATVRSRRCWG